MFWIAWRQHRLQMLAMAGVAAAAAGYLVNLSRPMVGPARLRERCAAGLVGEAECHSLFLPAGAPTSLDLALAALNLLPALIGVFWGAPLIAREFERGTHRLAWTQGVSRPRWLATKLAVLATAAVVGGATMSAVTLWATHQWLFFSPVNRFSDRTVFATVGAVPPALWLFALTVGTAAGLILRRTTAAMAATLAVLALTLVGLGLLRPHYATPEIRPAVTGASGTDIYRPPADYVLARPFRDAGGRDLTDDQARQICPLEPRPPDPGEVPCLQRHGLQQIDIYHPAHRFWRFQLTEAGILLAGAVLVGGLTLRRLARRGD